MRRSHIILIIFILAFASSVQAQFLPGLSVDTSLRVEYLFGHQSNRYSHKNLPYFNYDFDPRLTVLTGRVEVTPYPSLSGRLVGSVSVFDQSGIIHKAPAHTPGLQPSPWDETPHFTQWEAAGLYNMWNAEGYRFSFVAGYRQDNWTYSGPPVGRTATTQNVRDELFSSIPFIGLQTSMFFPAWKARFEVLGSPFMSRRVAVYQGNDYTIEGRPTGSGMLEFQFEGSTAVTHNIFLGGNAAYSMQELTGTSTITSSTNSQYDLFTSDSIFRVGFDVNIMFGL
jgi:hypothetical protein